MQHFTPLVHFTAHQIKYAQYAALKVIGMNLEQTPADVAFSKACYHLQVNCLVMASRRPIYTSQLTDSATQPNE